ncbi:MAG: tripartite tricarboxylate transporter substrate binding protein [Alphaproteobacteria bacterium]|nr:tripartite tricarboxylate transporter substrate binding protein [Alphaproteobacteria bacterium]
MSKVIVAALLCAASALFGADTGHAQAYPNKPIKMVVPFPAGGPTDAMARIVSDRLSAVLGQSVVVENRGGGAGGSIGAKFVATSDPDGYTFLITPGGALTTGPAVHPNIGYDADKAFLPVGQVMTSPLIMAVHPSVPAKTIKELVAYAKANPGKLTWGSQGFGTAPHLLAELFKLEEKVNILHVPYRGTAPMLAAIVAGEIQVVIDPMFTALPQVLGGKINALAVTSDERVEKLPNVPTVAQAGFPKLRNTFWLGVVVPAGTPAAIVDRLNAAFRDALAQPEARTRLSNLGATPKVTSPAEFGKFLADERAVWKGVVQAANIKVQ